VALVASPDLRTAAVALPAATAATPAAPGPATGPAAAGAPAAPLARTGGEISASAVLAILLILSGALLRRTGRSSALRGG
jgi:hypothetical protein